MIVDISSDAEADLVDGFWFYERQSPGLGDYFRSCLIADIDSLAYHGGIHEIAHGYHRALSKRFPFCIYYGLAAAEPLSRGPHPGLRAAPAVGFRHPEPPWSVERPADDIPWISQGDLEEWR
jgi:hypothetical protein